MPGIKKKNGDPDFVWGIFVVGLIFFASAFGATWLLVLMGWNPLSRGVYLYAAIAIAYSVGLVAVVAIFRWAQKPSSQFSKVNE